jgi:hypothetical protein
VAALAGRQVGRALAAALAAAAALAGCGGAARPARAPADSIVDSRGAQPLVNSLEVEPGTGDLLVTTNRGFFRVDPRRGKAVRIHSVATARGRSVPVGTYLEVLPVGPKTLLGSGHPDHPGVLPQYLGVMRSEDGGRTWSIFSRLGEADLHAMAERDGKLYGFDAVLGAVLASGDGGRSFIEHATPQEAMVDLEIDPGDPRRMLVASEQTAYRSEDGGAHWRPVDRSPGARHAWAAPDRLYRADATGTISVSADAGTTWHAAGRVKGAPARLKATGAGHLYLALGTGAILESRDGARSWRPVYQP